MSQYIVIAECAIQHGDKFLIIKRPQGAHAEGLLSFPGGKVEEQDGTNTRDALREAAKREVEEEVGLVLLDPVNYVTSSYFRDSFTQEEVIDAIFHCKLEKTKLDLKISEREVPEYYWKTYEELIACDNCPIWLKKYMQAVLNQASNSEVKEELEVGGVRDKAFFLKAQDLILQKIKESALELSTIRASKESILERWQSLIGILLPIQMGVIESLGFPKGQAGLSQFNQGYMEKQKEDLDLQVKNSLKWRLLFELAFDAFESLQTTLDNAKSLVRAVVSEMISEPFLQKVDLIEGASSIEKRKKLLDSLIPLHQKVIASFGLIGDKGYLQFQQILTEYFYDAEIAEGSRYAQQVVFRRLKIL